MSMAVYSYSIVPALSLLDWMFESYLDEFHTANEKCTVLRWMEKVGVKQWRDDKIKDHSTEFFGFMVNGELVGLARITPEPRHEANGMVGYAIRPKQRLRGYATIFLCMLGNMCLNSGFGKVTACVDVMNTGSIKAFEHAGWELTGRKFKWTYGFDEPHEAIEFVPQMTL